MLARTLISKMVSLNYLDGVSPWRFKSSHGSQNKSSRLRADRKRHSGRVPGAGEIYGNLGELCRISLALNAVLTNLPYAKKENASRMLVCRVPCLPERLYERVINGYVGCDRSMT